MSVLTTRHRCQRNLSTNTPQSTTKPIYCRPGSMCATLNSIHIHTFLPSTCDRLWRHHMSVTNTETAPCYGVQLEDTRSPACTDLTAAWISVDGLMDPGAIQRRYWNSVIINPLKPELNPICYLLALLGAHHFLHVSRIRVKLLTFRLLMS